MNGSDVVDTVDLNKASGGPPPLLLRSTSGSRESPLDSMQFGLCGGGSRSLGAAAFAR
jgi:hypothetical protein